MEEKEKEKEMTNDKVVEATEATPKAEDSKKRIKILFLPSDKFGVGMHRSVVPAVNLDRYCKGIFDVSIAYEPMKYPIEWFTKFDIIHFSKYIGTSVEFNQKVIDAVKAKGGTVIMDIDDYWHLGRFHPMGMVAEKKKSHIPLVENLSLVDYVTTTTETFAKEIRKHNSNVAIFPNVADTKDPQFVPHPTKSNRIRFGIICGSSHEHDIELLRGMTNALPKDLYDKVQFVLCGFDLRGSVKYKDPKTGEERTRQLLPMESTWYRYEKILTDDYKLVSPEYKEFLFKFLPNSEYPFVENEMYRRCWTKDIRNYMTHYNNIDVLLAPLKECDFNKMKSNLKTVEAGFMHKGFIAQDYGPYQIDTVSILNKDGSINDKGNCLLVDSRKNHKLWGKYITMLARKPELIGMMSENLYNTVKDKYSAETMSYQRAAFYLECYMKKHPGEEIPGVIHYVKNS